MRAGSGRGQAIGTRRIARSACQVNRRSSRVFGTVLIVATCQLLSACSLVEPDNPGRERILWHVEGQGFSVLPSMDPTTVYFGSFDHRLIAVDKSSGSVRWSAKTTGINQYTVGFNTVVAGDVVAMGDAWIYAYDRLTGAQRWIYRPEDGDLAGVGFLATDGSTIYAASRRNRAHAIDAATGRQLWVTQLPGEPGVTEAFNPRVHDGLVFVGTKRLELPVAGALIALDAATGAIRWVHDFTLGHPNAIYGYGGLTAFHGANAIAGVDDGQIYALDQTTGAVRWTAPRVHPLPPEPGGSYGDWRPVVVTGDVVVAGSTSGTTVGLDAATGAERWRFREPRIGVSFADVTTDGRLVFLRAAGGKLYTVDGTTGAVQWVMGSGASGPAVAGERTYLSAALPDDDRLYIAGESGYWAIRK